METEPTPKPPKAKRKRSSTPRVRGPKDPGILAIEQAAAKQKEEYRKAQESGDVLKRIIEKFLPRLTEAHRQELYEIVGRTPDPTPLAPMPISKPGASALGPDEGSSQ